MYTLQLIGKTAREHLEMLLTSLYFLCYPSCQTQSLGHTPPARRLSAPPPAPQGKGTLQSVWPSRGGHMALCAPGGLEPPLLGNQKT